MNKIIAAITMACSITASAKDLTNCGTNPVNGKTISCYETREEAEARAAEWQAWRNKQVDVEVRTSDCKNRDRAIESHKKNIEIREEKFKEELKELESFTVFFWSKESKESAAKRKQSYIDGHNKYISDAERDKERLKCSELSY